MLDRLDIHLDIPPVPIRALGSEGTQEASAVIRERVAAARSRQAARYGRERIFCNAQLKPRQVRRYCAIEAGPRALLEQAMLRLGLSARAYGRILRVARTIADLADSTRIEADHLAEAIQYRSQDRRQEF